MICKMPMCSPTIGGGCTHHACLRCYEDRVATDPTCPTCRAPVWNLVVDRDFALVAGCSLQRQPDPVSVRKVSESQDGVLSLRADNDQGHVVWAHTVNKHIEHPAGISLASKRGIVRVVTVLRGNGADRAGVRAGDVVRCVNGMPVRDHSTACAAIERRCIAGDCVVALHRPRRGWLRRWFLG